MHPFPDGFASFFFFFFLFAPLLLVAGGGTVSPGQAAKGYLGRVEAACLLEAAMSCSPYNHNLKVG